MPRPHYGAAIDRPENSKFLPISEFVWQQPQDSQLYDIQRNSTANIQRKNDVKAQTLPIRETLSQVSRSDTESLLENQTGSTPVQCLNNSKKQQNEIQTNETNMKTYDSGDDNIPPPKNNFTNGKATCEGSYYQVSMNFTSYCPPKLS